MIRRNGEIEENKGRKKKQETLYIIKKYNLQNGFILNHVGKNIVLESDVHSISIRYKVLLLASENLLITGNNYNNWNSRC